MRLLHVWCNDEGLFQIEAENTKHGDPMLVLTKEAADTLARLILAELSKDIPFDLDDLLDLGQGEFWTCVKEG